MILLLCAPALATVYTVHVGDSFADVVDSANDGDTINIDADYVTPTTDYVRVHRSRLTIAGDPTGPAALPPLWFDSVTGTSVSNAEFQYDADQGAEYYRGTTIPIALSLTKSSVALTNVVVDDASGMGVYAEDSDLTTSGCSFAKHGSYPAIYIGAPEGSHTLTMTDGSVTDNSHEGLWAWAYSGATMTVNVDGTTFTNNGANGGAEDYGVYLDNATASFKDLAFADTAAVWGQTTTAIHQSQGSLNLDTVTFTNMRGGDNVIDSGGSGATLDLDNVSMTWPDYGAQPATAITALVIASANLTNVTIDGPSTAYGAIDLTVTYAATLQGVTISHVTGSDAAIYASTGTGLTLSESRLCSNTTAAGALRVSGSAAVSGTVFGANRATGGVIEASGTGSVSLDHVDFVENVAGAGSIYSTDGQPDWVVTDSIFDSEGVAISSSARAKLSEGYNLWFANGTNGPSPLATTDVTLLDPAFVHTFDPAACNTDPGLLEGSPAMDKGFGGFDPDGSPYDIGAMSGASALSPVLLVDADGDRSYSLGTGGDDCNDTNPAVVGPCTGDTGANVDHDGDGYTPAQGDCDDTKSYVYPGAWDDPATTLDESCDGHNGCLVLGGGCACGTTEGTPGLASLALLVGFGVYAGGSRRSRKTTV